LGPLEEALAMGRTTPAHDDTMAEVGGFGSGGRLPGQFLAVGSIAVDSRGNAYTGEQHHGKRVQKWTPAGR